MDKGGGDQGPTGSDTGDDQRMATNPRELANGEAKDPDQTVGEDAESGAGYGNHAMPAVEDPAASS